MASINSWNDFSMLEKLGYIVITVTGALASLALGVILTAAKIAAIYYVLTGGNPALFNALFSTLIANSLLVKAMILPFVACATLYTAYFVASKLGSLFAYKVARPILIKITNFCSAIFQTFRQIYRSEPNVEQQAVEKDNDRGLHNIQEVDTPALIQPSVQEHNIYAYLRPNPVTYLRNWLQSTSSPPSHEGAGEQRDTLNNAGSQHSPNYF